ncbi:MAG: hypothetical protein MK165_19515 [Pirellulaceae bacterium]|nr:hypothetical protein [Pirellulaceae bacterium]
MSVLKTIGLDSLCAIAAPVNISKNGSVEASSQLVAGSGHCDWWKRGMCSFSISSDRAPRSES